MSSGFAFTRNPVQQSKSSWLNDNIINAVQGLFKNQTQTKYLVGSILNWGEKEIDSKQFHPIQSDLAKPHPSMQVRGSGVGNRSRGKMANVCLFSFLFC